MRFTVTPEPAWKADGVCREIDPYLWFADDGDTASTAVAKQVCRTCPVMQQCAEYAIPRADEWGVWGGLTAKERRRIRTARKDAA